MIWWAFLCLSFYCIARFFFFRIHHRHNKKWSASKNKYNFLLNRGIRQIIILIFFLKAIHRISLPKSSSAPNNQGTPNRNPGLTIKDSTLWVGQFLANHRILAWAHSLQSVLANLLAWRSINHSNEAGRRKAALINAALETIAFLLSKARFVSLCSIAAI